MNVRRISQDAIEQGCGILRLAPTWVPRSFCVPGRRLKLHPDDYYALGGERGGIDERWFSSTTPADNGPLTGPDEGLSQVVFEDGPDARLFLLRDAVAEWQGAVIGDRLWQRYGRWPIYSKFFDNKGPLPHHIHHNDAFAGMTGQLGKPEAYYFPPQMNNYGADFPYTFFGFEPGTTRDQVREALRAFRRGDNKITGLSRAYRLEVGTGWDVPPGLLHAPGSLCTYEPQKASDVFAMYQSVAGTTVVPEDLLWKDTPLEKHGDVEHLLDAIDWELNLDPEFAAHRFMRPRPVRPLEAMRSAGHEEYWICYKSEAFSAKELTVLPGRETVFREAAAYGLIVVQGHGTLGGWDVEAPALIRFGQRTSDEFFVSERAAREGVRICNPSRHDPLVMLKHFGPDHPDLDLRAR